jgi:hypothetical protein
MATGGRSRSVEEMIRRDIQLILKRASSSRPSGEWNDDDFDVLADGVVVGRIMKAAASPQGMSWLWTLAFKYHEDRNFNTWLCCDSRCGNDGTL